MTARKTAAPKTKAAAKPATRTASNRRQASPGPDTPVLEWVAAGVGLFLTAWVVGVIGWEALDRDLRPPAMQVDLRTVTPISGGYVAQFTLTNDGGSPAGQVVVEGVLSRPGGPAEVSDVTFDFVPDGSRRGGGLFFRSDPRGRDLQLRAKGYVEP